MSYPLALLWTLAGAAGLALVWWGIRLLLARLGVEEPGLMAAVWLLVLSVLLVIALGVSHLAPR